MNQSRFGLDDGTVDAWLKEKARIASTLRWRLVS
jgi:hypothetical protein